MIYKKKKKKWYNKTDNKTIKIKTKIKSNYPINHILHQRAILTLIRLLYTQR